MRTLFRADLSHAYFVLTDLDTQYHDVVRRLAFAPVPDGFARRFPINSMHLERAYENFARHAWACIQQAAGERPVPWERALADFLARVEGVSIDWWLGGSAALAVRGLSVVPGDFDLIVDDVGAHHLSDRLLDCLIEPVAAVDDWFCNWFGRAFLHARFEWVGGVDARADTPHISDFGPAAASQRETVVWRGYDIRVPPLEMQLATHERRGRHERAAQIRETIGAP